ncbi:hypothetical protein NXW27_21095 [Phocaeicola dorei]|nr:hypothetical protein [Phocaeicola dorei]
MKHPQQVMHFYKKLNFKSVLKCGVKVCRLADMKRRNESLDRTHAINHSAIAPKEVPAGSELFIYQIPDKG